MDQNRILFRVQITCVGHKYLVQIGSVMDIVSREETTDCKCSLDHNFNNMYGNKIHSVFLLLCRGSKQFFNPMGWLEW